MRSYDMPATLANNRLLRKSVDNKKPITVSVIKQIVDHLLTKWDAIRILQ